MLVGIIGSQTRVDNRPPILTFCPVQPPIYNERFMGQPEPHDSVLPVSMALNQTSSVTTNSRQTASTGNLV